jgi:hypothetical protein
MPPAALLSKAEAKELAAVRHMMEAIAGDG